MFNVLYISNKLKYYSLIFFIHWNWNVRFCNCYGVNYSYNYAKVRDVPSDQVSYPETLVGPTTHGPSASSILHETLRINGQIYNISKALGPEVPFSKNSKIEKIQSRNSLISARDSDLGVGTDTGMDNSSDSPDDTSDNTTPAPISGAIDYVLLPLIIMAVTAPILVVIYIVMGSVESKLAPNVQQRSAVNNRHTYFDVNAMYQGAKPVIGMLYETVSRALDYEECKERTACRVGTYAKRFRNRSPTFYDYVERFIRMFIPQRYDKPMNVYMASTKNQIEDCSKFHCFY